VYLASTQNGQPDDRSEIRMGRLAQVSKEDRDTACNILMLHTDLHSAFSKRTPEADVHTIRKAFRIAGITSFEDANLVERSNLLLRELQGFRL
jgi:hypothetical protein